MPPSKSFTNRALNLALLAEGACEIVRPLESEDTAAMRAALEALGRAVDPVADGLAIGPRSPVTEAEIDCGASGTMLRFLTASLAVLPGVWRLDGTTRLRERPLAPLIAALRSLGAGIDCLGNDGFAPLRIRGGLATGRRAVVDASQSSQFLSALLMAATRLPEGVAVEVSGLTSKPYLELTLQAMADFGVPVDRRGDLFSVAARPPAGGRYEVEGDFSSACYFAAAAALTGGEVELLALRQGSRQGDRRLLSILEAMGAASHWREGRLVVAGSARLSGVEVDLSDLPDQVPTLAALAPFAAGETRITGVGHLRLKESDRLAAMANGLERAGVAGVEVLDDGLRVPGVWSDCEPPSEPVIIDSVDDHRIAMAFAVLGVRRPGLSVSDPDVVAKSYPGFWDDLDSVGGAR